MSESTTVKVPIEINPPQQQTAQEKPAWARRSMHNVRMARQEVPLEPQWGENPDGSARLSWRPPAPEPEPEPPNVLEYAHAELNNLQNGVNAIMQNQTNGGSNQSGGELAAPDPRDYDVWDNDGAAEFQKANDAFITQAVAGALNIVLGQHREAMQIAQDGRDLNELVAEHGKDPRFNDIVKAALQLRNEHPELSLPKAFEQANDPKNAKPGAKGNAHAPAALTTGKKAIGNLGKLMFDNRMNGRAVPFPQKRGW